MSTKPTSGTRPVPSRATQKAPTSKTQPTKANQATKATATTNGASKAAPAQRQQNGKSAPKSTGQTNNPPDGAPDDQVNGAEEVEVSPTAVIDGWWKLPEDDAIVNSARPEIVVKLSDKHKQLIQETWPSLYIHLSQEEADTDGSIPVTGATRIFLRIFELSPVITEVFGFSHDMTTAEILSDGRLKAHAHRFVEAINATVNNLNDLDSHVAKAFVNLGKQHIRFRGIEATHFDVFSGAFMYVSREALHDKFTTDVSTAWRRLFDYVLQHLQIGYTKAVETAEG